MKKLFCIILVFYSISFSAQEEKITNSMSAGFHIAQYHRDFSLGIDISSPFFAANHIGVRFRANIPFLEHQDTKGNFTWSPYGNMSLGIVGVGGMIGESIRLYGEGGALLLLPSGVFSNKAYELGGYGLFGFEFFMQRNFNYHIEIGGAGTGAVADKISGRPIYSNGLIIQAGFRTQL